MKKWLFNKEIFGWAMFDFANSSYTTVIITVMFSRYFVDVVVNSTDKNFGEYLWGITLSISYFLVVITSPAIGAIADYSGMKKRFLFYSYVVCVGFTFLLFFAGKGDITLAIVFMILSNVGYSFGENLISSFLPEITTSEEIGRVSGYGWGLGYVGGVLALLGSIAIINIFGENDFSIRLTSVFTALFFAVSAIPTFLWLKERGEKYGSESILKYIRVSYYRLGETFHHIKEFKELVKLLLAYLFYYAGLMTVVSYSAIYAEKVFSFGNEELIILIIIVNTTSSVGAFLFGFIQDKIGAKRTLEITLILWIITIGGIYFTETQRGFWIMANLAGIVIGSSQSATRAMVGLFTPETKLAEFYGFWGFFGKLSSILGLYSFGFLSYITQSQKMALLPTLGFFIVGFIFVLWIREKEGIRHALEFEKEPKS